MKVVSTLTLLFLIYSFLPAQVVNTEKLRLSNTGKSLVGEIDVNFGLSRNKAGQTVRFGGLGRLELLKAKSKWMLLSGFGLTQFRNVDEPGSAPKNFSNNGFAHLRYNFEVNDWITWEAFTQAQYDEIQEVDLRTLTGTGPRFKLIQNDSSHLFWGALYMYEYENNSVETTGPNGEFTQLIGYERNHRLSTYLSGGINVTRYFSINHVTYFQPRLDQWSDFRISSETTLTVKLTNRISLKSYFQFIFDDRPPATVPRTMYNFTNGLSASF